MNRDQITEGLRMLKMFESAVKQYEEAMTTPEEGRFSAAACRVTMYSDMPMGTGSGSRVPTLSGQMGLADVMEYNRMQYMIRWLRNALNGLNFYERYVIEQKWLEGHTLEVISKKFKDDDVSLGMTKIKNIHSEAMRKLEHCLQFVDYHPSVTVRQRVSNMY